MRTFGWGLKFETETWYVYLSFAYSRKKKTIAFYNVFVILIRAYGSLCAFEGYNFVFDADWISVFTHFLCFAGCVISLIWGVLSACWTLFNWSLEWMHLSSNYWEATRPLVLRPLINRLSLWFTIIKLWSVWFGCMETFLIWIGCSGFAIIWP
jgi:hypothetical protein